MRRGQLEKASPQGLETCRPSDGARSLHSTSWLAEPVPTGGGSPLGSHTLPQVCCTRQWCAPLAPPASTALPCISATCMQGHCVVNSMIKRCVMC